MDAKERQHHASPYPRPVRRSAVVWALWLAAFGGGSPKAGLADDVGTARPTAETLAHACAGCHGTYGHSHPPTPAIAGKPLSEFVRIMQEFKSGRRRSSIMNRIARGYADEDFVSLGRFFQDTGEKAPDDR